MFFFLAFGCFETLFFSILESKPSFFTILWAQHKSAICRLSFTIVKTDAKTTQSIDNIGPW